MFENVIAGVDGRPNGRDAIALAARLVAAQGKLTLANVHPGAARPIDAVTPGEPDAHREASHELLERERSEAGVQAELVSYAEDSPGRGLHRLAEEQQADLLVVGSCSRGTINRVLVGDDTRDSLNGAPCAVAIATHGYALDAPPLTSIGVGYDGTAESELALAAARELASATGAGVSVLEVVSLPSYAYAGEIAPNLGGSIEAMLDEATKRVSRLQGVEAKAVYGLVGEELTAFGADKQLLVVGSRGYGPVERLIVGSTSNYLQRHAHCSLLVLPRAAA